jgi:hypothetical protein
VAFSYIHFFQRVIIQGLLDGTNTSWEKLQSKAELVQFWKLLAATATTGPEGTTPGGYAAAGGNKGGPRVDLIACRVLEAPQEGAALLKELWLQTGVPFAASDDALNEYRLSTFYEDPHTRAVTLMGSTIQALNIYFSK